MAEKNTTPEFARDIWENLAKWLHKQKSYDPKNLADPEPLAAIRETHRILSQPLQEMKIGQEIPEELTAALNNNIFYFSGFKTHHELVQASRMLKDSDGNFKPFHKFLNDIETLNKTYNKNYLRVEYNFATASTQMAVKWKEWEQDEERYNLQYRTAGDDRVREEHAALNGVTLPPSDPFWNSYLPPNGWNCRCTTVQVRKNKYPQSNSEKAMAAGAACTAKPKQQIFRFNPGKTMTVFPPKHPYYKVNGEVKKTVEKIVASESKSGNEKKIPEKYQLKAKTVADAEKEITQKLGVTSNFKGFTKKDLSQIQDIFHCVAEHFDKYPELKKKIRFVGSMQGRREVYAEHLYDKLKELNPNISDDRLRKEANIMSKRMKISSHTYALSSRGNKYDDLNGVSFNAMFRGEKIQKSLDKDVKNKWHPENCNTVKAVFDHELGHKMDELLELRTDPEFLKIFNEAEKQGKEYIKDNLSKYAYVQSYTSRDYDPKAEFIAEAWSEYLNNPTPRHIAKSVGELIVKKSQ